MVVRIEAHAEPIPGYRLIERLGGGGFGEVWKCEAPGGLHKAIKFVYGELGESSEDTHRAEQELKALSRVKTVRHPYILSLERYDIIGCQLLIVMELADKNLWDRFRECRGRGLPGIPRDELLGYMEETAEALDLMNGEYQLQHLDIKPQNLFLVHNHVKVADFGLVKALEGMQASVTGGVTPVYAAPETFDGWVSRFCDQYSLAIVYQEMLTGQRPFNGNNVRHLILQHLQAAPNLGSLPPEDQPIIGKGLAKAPEDRHPSCRDMVRGLRGAPSVAPADPPRAPTSLLQLRTAPPAEEPRSGDDGKQRVYDEPTPAGEITASLRKAPGETPGLGAPTTDPGEKQTHGTDPLGLAREAYQAPAEVAGDGALFPALVIGLGQQGLSVLARLRQQLQQRLDRTPDLPSLRLLLLDTDPEVVRAAARGPSGARLPEANIFLAPLSRPSHYLKPRDGKARFDTWINPRMLYRIPRSQVTTGVRALGRLAFCDHHRSITRRIQLELETMLEPDALTQAAQQTGLGVRSNRPRVYIVTGLAGGTGSGMFLDLAYTVRALLRHMGYAQPDVVGLFLLPPVDPAKTRVLPLGNTCAALRELLHFARPGTTFSARYHEREEPVRDGEPPFSRCLLLPLPEETDEQNQAVLTQMAGQMLWRELCSPLGQAAPVGRASLPPPPDSQHGLFFQTFGLFNLRWPRANLHQAVARQLCQRLVQDWMSKDSKPIRERVQTWVQEQRARRDLEATHFLGELTEACKVALGQDPLDAAAAIIKAAQAGEPGSGEYSAEGGGKPKPQGTAWMAQALENLGELLGRVQDDGLQEVTGKVPLLLQQASDKLVQDWGQKLAELPVQLIEEPGFRLAGAEEAVRLLSDSMEQMLQHHEPLARELGQRAAELHGRVQVLIAAGFVSPGQRNETSFFRRGGNAPANARADLAALLQAYAKARLQHLVMVRMLGALVTLRGHLADEMREINFCRVRLSELRQMLEHPGEELVGTSAFGRPTSQEQPLFPTGCDNLKETVARLVATLEVPELLHALDSRMEAMLRKQFRALVNVCLSSANLLRNVEAALLQTAQAFVGEHLPQVDVAALFLERYPSEEAAEGELVGFFDEAAPESLSSGSAGRSTDPASSGPEERAELCVLGTPASPAGEHIRSLVQKALPQTQWLIVPTSDDIVFYREQVNLPLEKLPQLGPAAQDAYRQMTAAENFTPHTRTDVEW
jgi:serine/threonine protein kinase